MFRRWLAASCLVFLGSVLAGSSSAISHEGLSGTLRCASETSYAVYPVGITDESLVVSTNFEFGIESYSLRDCSLNWRQVVGPQVGDSLFTSEVTYASTDAMSPSPDGYAFVAINNSSGEVIWTRARSAVTDPVMIVENIVISSGGGRIEGINAKDGSTIWSHPFRMWSDGMVVFGTSVVGFTNPFFSVFGSENKLKQELVSIDIASGHLNWRRRVKHGENFNLQSAESAVLVASDRVNEDTVVTAWDLTSGAVLWRRLFDDPMWTVCRLDGSCILDAGAGNEPNYLRLATLGRNEPDRKVYMGFAPLTAAFRGDNVVAVGPCADPFDTEDCTTQYALIDLKTWKVKWTQTIGGRFLFPNMNTDIVYESGMVYIDTRAGITVMNEVTGQTEWRHELPPVQMTTGFRVFGGTVGLTAQAIESGYIYVFDAPPASAS